MLIAADPRETVLRSLPSDSEGMEIGVWRGQFSARILKTADPKILHLVDPWQPLDTENHKGAWYAASKVTARELDEICDGVKKQFAKEITSGKIVIHRATSTETLQTFADNSIDYVYIDGDHTYDAVLADLTNAFRIVRVGGLICGDDYALGGWWRGGVVHALHKFLTLRPVVMELLLGTQFVLRKLTANSGPG